MSTYVKVKDGQIQEDTIGPLPDTGYVRNSDGALVGVSSFDRLPPGEIKKAGWLRYIDGGEPAHDPATHEAVATGYRVNFDWVDRTYEVRPRAPYLSADPTQIPADDEAASTLAYVNAREDAPAEVTFSVNGAKHKVAIQDGRASLEVTTLHPGVVLASVDALPGTMVTITATEA